MYMLHIEAPLWLVDPLEANCPPQLQLHKCINHGISYMRHSARQLTETSGTENASRLLAEAMSNFPSSEKCLYEVITTLAGCWVLSSHNAAALCSYNFFKCYIYCCSYHSSLHHVSVMGLLWASSFILAF